jgi:simple sugar transport system permease protein
VSVATRRAAAVDRTLSALEVLGLAMLVSAAVVLVLGHDPARTLAAILHGAFGSADAIHATLVETVPLVFAGLAVALPLRLGLFNIGAEGQLILGGLAAGVVAAVVPSGLAIAAAVAAALLVGGAWGAIPGYLRARLGVHEVLSTILLNLIAIPLAGWLVSQPAVKAEGDIVQTEIAAATLPEVYPALGVAVVLAVAYDVFLSRTRAGLSARAIGLAPRASHVLGLPVAQGIVLSMAAAGAFAGLGRAGRRRTGCAAERILRDGRSRGRAAGDGEHRAGRRHPDGCGRHRAAAGGDDVSAVIDLVDATLRESTPLLLATLGGVMSERSGVINLGLEAYLLAGAFGAAAGTLVSGSLLFGAAVGIVAALAIALLHALICTRTRADHVVAGVALNLLVDAATIAALVSLYRTKGASPPFADELLERLEGSELLGHAPATWIALAAVPLVAWTLVRTKAGLRLRAVGENPACAESLGVSARRVRVLAVLAAGLLTGLGGVYLAFDVGSFSKHMAGGRGYLALACVVIGKWRPGTAAAAALGFALLTALANQLQVSFHVPDEIPRMFPYVVTLVVLSGIVGRARPPAALGEPLVR